MALSAGDICAIVFGVYSLIITILFIALLLYFIKQRKTKKATPAQNTTQRPGVSGTNNRAFDSQDGNSSHNDDSLRIDLEGQQRRNRDDELSDPPPIGYVKVELRRDEVQRQASVLEDVVVVRQGATRQDSIDALSFGTVLSSDDDDNLDEEAKQRKLEKRRTVVNLSENPGLHEFSSVKSDSDSGDTLYDDVIAVTPKVGARPTGTRPTGRPSVSSTLSHEFFDVQEFDDGNQPDNVYLDLTGERTSSESDGGADGNDDTYDDVRVNSTKKPRKKAPPPKPPQQPKYPTNNEAAKVMTSSANSASSSSSSSSSEESPELRKKEYLAKDREEARRSYQSAPEQYRKESSYLEVTEDIVQMPKKPSIENIREEDSTNLSYSTSSSSTMSSTSSKASVIRPHQPVVEQIRPTLENKIESEKPVGRVRLDSSSSSSSSQSENISEEIPKYLPRKSSFSSPSEIETDHRGDVVVFGDEPGESVDEDVVKMSKKIRTHSSDSSDSDSDSSASQASFHIEQAEFVRKLDKPLSIEGPVIVRTVTNSNKSIERKDSVSTQSETESRPESPTPVKAMIKMDLTDGGSQGGNRRSSTSSSASSASSAPSSNKSVEQNKRPSLVRSVEAFDQDDFPVQRVNSVKKNVRIANPQSSSSSESSDTEYSSYAEDVLAEDEEPSKNIIPTTKVEIVEMEDSNVSEDDDESGSETSESSSENENVQPRPMTNGKPLTINLQQNGRRESGSSLSSTADINVDNNVEEMIFETPKIVYAKEVIVKDEVPVRQCEPVEVHTSSSSSSSSGSESSDEDAKGKIGLPMIKKLPTPKLEHANTLPAMTTKQAKKPIRQDSSSSSQSSASSTGPSPIRRVATLTENQWSPSILKRLNRNYEPVYKLRKVNSMTQTDRSQSTEN